MNQCFNCMFMHPDWDKDGNPIRPEYCHYVGPDEWAPCADDEAEEDEAYNEYYAAVFASMVEPTFEEYGAPYDYQEFQKGIDMIKQIRILLEDDLIEEFDFDFDDDMSEDDIYQSVCEYIFGNIEIEVI